MSNQALTISFVSGLSGSADRYWLKIEQVGIEPDLPTRAEAASVIDALYQIEPCTGAVGGDPALEDVTGQPIPPTSAEDFSGIVIDNLSFNSCRYGSDGSCEVMIRVYRSHQDEPYKLNLVGGEIVQTVRMFEDVVEDIMIKDALSVDLKYPAVSGIDFFWRGQVHGAAGQVTVEPVLVGSTVNFIESITGHLQVKYQTVYDLVTIKILPVDNQPGDCEVFGFYCQTVTSLMLQKPLVGDGVDNVLIGTICKTSSAPSPDDRVDCYKQIQHLVKCKCSGEIKNTYWTEQSVPCPEGIGCPAPFDTCRRSVGVEVVVEYTDCGETDNELNDPAFYEKTCCEPPTSEDMLPACVRTTSLYMGGKGIAGGKAKYRALFGSLTKFVAVSPHNGICGKLVVEQVKNQKQCCEGVAAITPVLSSSSEVLSPNTSGPVHFTGGKSPYNVSIRGYGFWADEAHTEKNIVVENGSLFVYLDSGACGSCTISIFDGCSSSSMTLRATTGQWGPQIPLSRLEESPLLNLEATEVPDYGIGVYSATQGRYRVSVITDELYSASTSATCLGTDDGRPVCMYDDVAPYIAVDLLAFCNGKTDESGKLWVFSNMLKSNALDPNGCCSPDLPKVPQVIQCWYTVSGFYQEWTC